MASKRGTRVLISKSNTNLPKSKRSQLSIFIILAIIIVAGLALFFLLRGKITVGGIPAKFQPIEDYFLSCIENYAKQGVEIMHAQAGYIYLPEFEAGSSQNPFSSQLNFQGVGIPYWYYISGNGIFKEQMPTKTEMQEQLAKYIEESINLCDFSIFEERNFSIEEGEAKADVKINDNYVGISLDMPLTMEIGEESARQTKHDLTIDTKLGDFYNKAKIIYDKEKKDMFLENYSIDVLRLYAPVDGVEISCSPKIWSALNVSSVLKEALEENIRMIRQGKEKDYFVKDFGFSENVGFLYDRRWPSRVEIWPAEESLMKAEPVGLQAGLGALGFCYVPYHFVYDVSFPVLIQIYNDNELFQFPVAVIIDKNIPREALEVSLEQGETEICGKANTKLKVYTYDTSLEPVEASISFKCLDETCSLGKTKISGGDAYLEVNVPQCANAIIYAEAEDYVSDRGIVSTVQENEVNLLMNKKYEEEVGLLVDGKENKDMAVINFISDKYSTSVAYPYQKSVKLIEASYDVVVYVYKNASISLPEARKRQCVDEPRAGILGIFGLTQEKCFDIKMPSQILSNVISGGGKVEQYITEYELKKGKMDVEVESLPLPSTIDDLQENYDLLEDKKAYLEFKNE